MNELEQYISMMLEAGVNKIIISKYIKLKILEENY